MSTDAMCDNHVISAQSKGVKGTPHPPSAKGVTGYRLIQDDRPSQPVVSRYRKGSKQINANEDAIVAASMENIDAEYKALCESFALASV